MPTSSVAIPTPYGPASVQLRPAQSARGALLLGHGAGGGTGAPDLQAATQAAAEHGFSVGLVEQPYRVAGRRSPAPAGQLDLAWTAVTAAVAGPGGPFAGLPLVVGGRSSGARVACRTADALGAAGVLCLAFPLLPPRRKGSARLPESRLPELDAVSAPMLIVQGESDRFGMPPAAPGRTVARVTGDHSLRSDLQAIRSVVRSWLAALAA